VNTATIENPMVVGAADAYERMHSDDASWLETAFIAAIVAGQDHVLPWHSDSQLRYPVSESLGECSKPAQRQLFQACHLALNQHADDASVRAALAAFVNICAADKAS